MQPRNECDQQDINAYGIIMDRSCLTDFAAKFGPQPDKAACGLDQAASQALSAVTKDLDNEFDTWKTGG
jgi:hypothetical protein